MFLTDGNLCYDVTLDQSHVALAPLFWFGETKLQAWAIVWLCDQLWIGTSYCWRNPAASDLPCWVYSRGHDQTWAFLSFICIQATYRLVFFLFHLSFKLVALCCMLQWFVVYQGRFGTLCTHSFPASSPCLPEMQSVCTRLWSAWEKRHFVSKLVSQKNIAVTPQKDWSDFFGLVLRDTENYVCGCQWDLLAKFPRQ